MYVKDTKIETYIHDINYLKQDRVLGSGQSFGQNVLLYNDNYEATVVTITDTHLITINNYDYCKIMYYVDTVKQQDNI